MSLTFVEWWCLVVRISIFRHKLKANQLFQINLNSNELVVSVNQTSLHNIYLDQLLESTDPFFVSRSDFSITTILEFV